MPARFTLREMASTDSAALASLTEQSPDGGNVAFSPRFHVPAYEIFKARQGDMMGVVVEAEDTKTIVGTARVAFGECQFEGSIHPYALLNSLMVHPDYRRQGIASTLAQWRIDRAVQRNGSDGLILADIQTGNTGSIANAKKWASEISGKIITCPVPMRSKPPRSNSSIIVREATHDDLEQIAQNLNTFYQNYNFYRPQTADNLHEWLQKTPLTTPVNHYLVATDRSNRLLAGMGLKEEGRMMSLHIGKVPPMISIANLILRVIPPDHEMRTLQAEKLWFLADELEAALALWQTVRWEWRERGSNLVCNYDPRSPLRHMLQIPIWMPSTSISLALRAPIPMSQSRLLDPLI